ncbi:hypothetical protein BGZ54_004180 [Gamsiella multidivaricata]|nr:hypothetical protein BGZ54_004180 [Gamsiella multidivaricata]
MPLDFEGTSEHLLAVWRITVPKNAATAREPVVLSNIQSKQEVFPFHKLSDHVELTDSSSLILFVVDQIPPEYFPRERVRQMEVEVFLSDTEKPRTMMWNVVMDTTCPEELEIDIIEEFPDLIGDQHRTLTLVMPPAPSRQVSWVFRPITDYDLQSTLRDFIRRDISPLRINYKVSPLSFSEATLPAALRLYKMHELEEFMDFPAASSTSDRHTQALDRLFTSLSTLLDKLPLPLEDEYQMRFYVATFLLQVVSLLPGWCLRTGKEVHCSHAEGRTDYTIESKEDPLDAFPITIIKDQEIDNGVAQNMMQLDAISCRRKRKFEEVEQEGNQKDDDVQKDKRKDADMYGGKRKDGDEREGEQKDNDNQEEKQKDDDEVPIVSYGIVTDLESWHIVEYTRKPSSLNSTLPTFRRATLPTRIDLTKDQWKENVTSIFGVVANLSENFVRGVGMHRKRRKQ